MHPWMTARILEQRRQNRSTHPHARRRRSLRRAARRSRRARRSRWLDRVVPAESTTPRRRGGRRP